MTTIDDDNGKDHGSFPSSFGVLLPEATDSPWPEPGAGNKPKMRTKKIKKKVSGGGELAVRWGPLDSLAEDEVHEKAQPPSLDQILHAVTKLDSQQQVQLEALMNKVSNIEEQVLKALEPRGGGCLDTSATEPSAQEPPFASQNLPQMQFEALMSKFNKIEEQLSKALEPRGSSGPAGDGCLDAEASSSLDLGSWSQAPMRSSTPELSALDANRPKRISDRSQIVSNRSERRYRSSQRRSRLSHVSANPLPPLVEVESHCPESPDDDHGVKTHHSCKTLHEQVSHQSHNAVQAVETMRVTVMNTSLHVAMAGIIALQTIHIGISMDHDNDALTILDWVFTVCFISEIVLKCRLHTVKGFFSSGWNWFDFGLIIIDLGQAILSELLKVSAAEEIPSVALLRMVRLLRLIRVVRLSKLEALKDFSFMVNGIVAGTMTLCWALVLFGIVVYLTALLFREVFGRQSQVLTCPDCNDVDIVEYFDSVPRSMMTVFRLFLGDFGSIQGINFYEGIQTTYGAVHTSLVMSLFFMVSIGVFNVISAIFVERAVAASEKLQRKRKTQKEKDLWKSSIETVIGKLFETRSMHLGKFTVLDHGVKGINFYKEIQKTYVEGITDQTIKEEEFATFILEPAVSNALSDLGLDEADLGEFFDMLDNDNTGACTLFDLISGIKRLQGSARRSDIITIDLMVREIQQQVDHHLMPGMEELLKGR